MVCFFQALRGPQCRKEQGYLKDEFAVVKTTAKTKTRKIHSLDQFVRVLLNLACIKYPDSRDEETAFGFVLHGHVLPYTVQPAQAGVLDDFFDSAVCALTPVRHTLTIWL